MTTTRGHPPSLQPPAATWDDARTAPYPRAKRVLDLVVGSLALVVVAPTLAAIRIAMWVAGDKGPFLYRAQRVGEGGRLVTILKIRTMTPEAGGSALTSRDDDRVTRIGRILRRYKFDEFPQLWNVVRGEMALVGPRPEDPAYVDFNNPEHRRVFTARPGITGLAQLAYRHEADLLVGEDAERHYRETILPAKLKLDREYLDRRSVRLDVKILGLTAASIVAPRQRVDPT
ncbi:MAG TPA: sugar transferase [Candidatus Limnocylindrales bacterium]|nr:sugar transferase [Candidatus Limnocylindrales bacterium]